eukprot:3933871-Pyramimonas_sp.AAC.1
MAKMFFPIRSLAVLPPPQPSIRGWNEHGGLANERFPICDRLALTSRLRYKSWLILHRSGLRRGRAATTRGQLYRMAHQSVGRSNPVLELSQRNFAIGCPALLRERLGQIADVRTVEHDFASDHLVIGAQHLRGFLACMIQTFPAP